MRRTAWPSPGAASAAVRLSDKASGRAAVVYLAKSLRALSSPEPTTPSGLISRALTVAQVASVKESASLESAGLLLDFETERFIFVRDDLDDRTKNWTIAHELAHTVLSLAETHSEPEYVEIERRCEIFAAEFLLPKVQFPKWMKGWSLDSFHEGVLRASRELQVPIHALVIRMRDLSLLSETRALSVFVRQETLTRWTVVSAAYDRGLRIVLEEGDAASLLGFGAEELARLEVDSTISRRLLGMQISIGNPSSVRSGQFRATRLSGAGFLLSYRTRTAHVVGAQSK